METANETTFIRVGTVILNVRMIAYAWMEDDMMVIMLNALDGQGKPKKVHVPNPESEKVLEYLMARTVIDVRPPEE